MAVNGIRNQTYYQNTSQTRKENTAGQGLFGGALTENLNIGSGLDKKGPVSSGQRASAGVLETAGAFSGVSSSRAAMSARDIRTGSMTECKVRNLSFADCDYVKPCVTEGYVLKMKLESNGTIYIEQKNEDGTVRAFMADPVNLNPNTADPVELAALEAWRQLEPERDLEQIGYVRNREGGKPKAPYSFLAKNGEIVHNGITFQCDDFRRILSLGDISDPKEVLTIPMADGGTLKVNRQNLGDLMKAIDMFSPEDVRRIMEAIAQDNKARQVQEEIEEDKNSLGDSADQIQDADKGKAQETEKESGNASREPYDEKVPLEILALMDEKYTDGETGISWYVGEGREPYMLDKDIESLKSYCRMNGVGFWEKYTEMTGRRLI